MVEWLSCYLDEPLIFVLLHLGIKESLFIFDSRFYREIDGVDMGSPLGIALANIFIFCFENKWLKDYPCGLKPIFYRICMYMPYLYYFSLPIMDKRLRSVYHSNTSV